MAVGTPKQTDQVADYVCKPEELDPNRVLLYLPRWSVETDDEMYRTWTFREPDTKLLVQINSGMRGLENKAVISSSGPETRIDIYKLKLILAQIRSGRFCLGLYNSNGSYYISDNKTGYEISVWTGRDPQKVPSWTDHLPFIFGRTFPRSNIRLGIPRETTN